MWQQKLTSSVDIDCSCKIKDTAVKEFLLLAGEIRNALWDIFLKVKQKINRVYINNLK